MRLVIISLCLLIGKLSYSQDAPVYTYYFLEIRTTGKAEVEITPEMGVKYPDIDSLIVSKREPKKNGGENITGVKYPSYSDAFNKLSSAGLEFVQFANLSTFGGGTAMLAGDLRINYIVWRKRVK